MAGTLLSIGTDQLQNQRKGAIAISLTDFDVTTVSQIAAGSILEIGGAVLLFESDESMGANWAAMAQGVVYAYINGTTYESTYTATAPTWSDEKQGWYDGTGAHRYYARFYKDAGANYTRKALYTNVRGVMTMYDGVAADGLDMRGISDGDRSIKIASDAEILWDESEDRFIMKNDHRPRLSVHDSTERTQDYVFDLLSPYVPNVNDEIYFTGMIKGPPSGTGQYYSVNRLRRTGANTMVIYGYDIEGLNELQSETFTDGVGTRGWQKATFVL